VSRRHVDIVVASAVRCKAFRVLRLRLATCADRGKTRAVRWTFVTLLTLASCGSEEAEEMPRCLDSVEVETCSPSFPPEFHDLFTGVFSQTCASDGTSCHGDLGRKGGLAFVDEDEAYGMLLGLDGSGARVAPGDPRCSELVVRLDSTGKPWSMPRSGGQVDEPARCSIRRWIADGAQRGNSAQ
jgi:hypothetical protein